MSTASTTRFRVEGMDCAGCASKVDTAVRRLSGVADVAVSVVSGTMTVEHTPGTDIAAIADRVSSLGYAAAVLAAPNQTAQGETHAHQPAEGRWWQSPRARSTLGAALAVAAAFGFGSLVPASAQWAFLVAMLVGLVPVAHRALQAARNGSPFSIETLMSVAAIGAVVIGAAEEAAIVVLLFLVGELLEGLAAGRARAGIRALADLVPKTALRETPRGVDTIAADSLLLGDIVLVRPGDRIPADGIVVSGDSEVDEAPVTGESVPKPKSTGDAVFAGTVNHHGVLRIRVTAAASDNTIARIVALVEQAQDAKAPTERFIDRFSRIYTPGVMIVAALVAVLPPVFTGAEWIDWVYKGLAILLIGCPCALVISTPAAIAASLAAGARQGLLMKGGAVLERLGKVDLVAFDKTGTLTEGRPRVTDIVGIGASAEETLAFSAALETGSSHPLAMAILARAGAEGIRPGSAVDLRAIGGKGVSGRLAGVALFLGSPAAAAATVPLGPALEQQIAALNQAGKTVSVLLADNAVAGLIALRDEPRADAAAGLAALRTLGVRTLMLTGDAEAVAKAIGRDLDMEPRAGLLPDDKQRIVAGLMAEGRVVAKVGDGINDAPALATADIGIAMGGGTDVALETADAAALHARVGDVAAMIALSRATMANIVQNIVIALGLKAVFLVTTVLGITGLWPAILADTGATVLVTANAMRLLAWSSRR